MRVNASVIQSLVTVPSGAHGEAEAVVGAQLGNRAIALATGPHLLLGAATRHHLALEFLHRLAQLGRAIGDTPLERVVGAAQRLLLSAPGADVAGKGHDAALALGATEAPDVRLEPAPRAIAAPHAEDHRARLARVDGLLHLADRGATILHVDEVDPPASPAPRPATGRGCARHSGSRS